MQKLKPVNNEQLFLLPPSIEDFIPSNHLPRVVNEVVETIDVTEIEAKYSYLVFCRSGVFIILLMRIA